MDIKISPSESSQQKFIQDMRNLLNSAQDMFANKKFNINVDMSGLESQIKSVKTQMEEFQKQILNAPSIELKVDTSKTNANLDELKQKIQEVYGEGKKDITIDVKTNVNSAIATLKSLDGMLNKKISIEVPTNDELGNVKYDLNSMQLKSTTDKSDTVNQKQNIKDQSQLYEQASILLKEKYQLEEAINSAELKGYENTAKQLTLLKEENQLKLNQIAPQLNESNNSKIIEQEMTLIDKKDIKISESIDKTKQENEQIEKQIELYKQDVDSRLKNLQTQSKKGVFDNSDVQAYVEQINQLKDNLNTENFSESKNQISSAFKGAGAEVRELNSEATKTHGIFGNLLHDGQKMAEWAVSGGILFGLVNSFKDAIDSAVEMDSTMATLSITMNTTKQGLQQMKEAIQQTAIATGSSIDQVSAAAKVYANMNETMDSIMAKSKSAIELSNVSGLDTKDTTDSIHAIINEFNLANQDVTKTSTHIADSLVNISANMAMDFGSGINEITKGIQQVGSVAQSTGKMTVEQTEAMIGAIVEKTRLGGPQVGNAIRTIMARVYQSKSIDSDVSAEDMSKTSKMLSQLGVSVNDKTTGSFKNFSTILQEVANKEKNMTDSQKSAINEQMSGIRQVNILSSALESMNKIQDLTNKGVNSNNALQNANNKHMDTASAKWKQFSAIMETVGQNLVNTDILKGILNLFNSLGGTLMALTSTHKALGIAVGVLTTAFIACSVAIKSMGLAEFETKMMTIPGSILNIVKSVQSLDDVLALAQFAGEGLMKVLIMNPLTWIGVAVAGLITLVNYEQQLDTLGKDVQSTMTSLHKSMQNQDVSGIDAGLSKIKEWQSELDKAKAKMDDWSSGLKGVLAGGFVGTTYRTAYNDKLNEIQNEAKDKTGESLKIDSFGKIDTSKYQKEETALNQLKSLSDELSNSTSVQNSEVGKLAKQYLTLAGNTDKTKSQQKEQKDVVNQLKKTFGDLTISIDKSGNVTIKNISTLKDHIDALNADAQAAANAKQQQDALAQTMTDAQDNIKEYSKYIKDMNANNGNLPAADVEEIEKKHSELIPYLTNEADLYKQIQDAINKEKDTANTAYEQMMESSDAYWKENDSAKQSMIDGVNELAKKDNGYFQTKAKEYLADIDNAKSMKEAEVAIEKDLVAEKEKIDKGYQEAVNKFEQDEVNGKASEKDAQSAADAKKKLDDITKQQSDWDAIEKKARSQIQTPSVIDNSDETSEGLNKTTNSLKEQKQQAEEDKLEMKDYNNEINALKLSEKALDDALQNTNQHSQEAINLLSQKAELIKQEISLTEQQIKTQEALAQAYASGSYSGGSSYSGGGSSGGTWNGQYASFINQAASKYGVDANLIAAVITQESGWNPNSTSSAGAKGLMQKMEGTNLYDPQSNIMQGTQELAEDLHALGGNVQLALAAYNAGLGAVQKYGGIPPYSETQNYVPSVMKYYNQYSGGNYSSASSSASSAMENQKNSEQAQANALQLKGTLLDLNETLKEIPYQKFQAAVGIMEDAIESFSNQMNIAKDTMDNFSDNTTTHIDDITNLWESGNKTLVNKMTSLQQEYAYVQSQINTGGYTDADYAQMKLKLTQLQDDIVKERAEIDGFVENWINKITGFYNYDIEYQDKSAQHFQADAELLKNDFADVVTFRQDALDRALQKQKSMQDEEAWLTKQIQSNRFDSKNLQQLGDKLKDLQDAETQYDETIQKMKADIIDANFDNQSHAISDNISLLKSQLDLLNKIGVGYNDAFKTSTMTDLISQQFQYNQAITSTIDSLKDQMDALVKAGNLGSSQYTMLKDEYDKYLKDLQQSTSDIYESVSNIVKEQVDVQTNAWDKAQKVIDKNIQDQEKSLDTTKNSMEWLKTQENDLSSAKDIRTELVRLQADNSPENQAKIRELQQQLVSASKKTNEDVVNHRIDTEKQGLEDLKTNEDQKIQDAKDKLTDLVNSTQANIAKALESLLDKNNGDITKIGQQIQDTILTKIDYIKQSVGDIVDLVNNSSDNPFDINSLINSSSLSDMSSSNKLLSANVSGLQYKSISMPSAEKVTNNDNSQNSGDTHIEVNIDNRNTKMNSQQMATTVINEVKKRAGGRVFTK